MRHRLVAPLGASLLAAFVLLTPDARAQSADPTFGDETAGPDEIAGEIAVDLRDDASDADIADLDAHEGITLRPSSVWSTTHDRLEIADVDPAREASILDDLSRDSRVEHAEPMAIYRATFVPDDPLYASKQWHLARVGAESAWEYTCGQGITVAVIDTGVACFDKGPFSRGTDLSGTRCEGGWNFVNDDAEAADDHGHGTHVAGTIAQTTNNGMGTAGLAYCATLMPIKVLSKQGFGSTANVAEGIRFAADNGAQIINMSLGGPIKSKILEDAVNHAIARGVVVVAAAGNSGRSVGWPAAYPGVVAVSATDDKDKIAWFSSRGPEVAIAAPGVAVTQQTICNGGQNKCEIFGTFNGTSMASPHVAGIAAMIEGMGVTDGAAVRDVLTSTARPKDEPKLYGAGIVDAGAAARRVFWRDLTLRTVALLGLFALVASRIRKRGGTVVRNVASVGGAIIAGIGLLPFAPVLGFGRFASLAMRPLGEWDLVLLGAGVHKWLLLASALPALALTMVAFTSRRVRPLIGGIALGSAALLAQHLVSGDVAYVGGPMLAKVWLAANGLLCLWLARMALDAKRG
ncbi:MAG TPA: S8 family peptidase [Polyangiaceae bacterium]|jgi:serine protease